MSENSLRLSREGEWKKKFREMLEMPTTASTGSFKRQISETVFLTLIPTFRGKVVVGMTVDKMTKMKPRTLPPGALAIQVNISAPHDIFDWAIPMIDIEIPASAIAGSATTKVELGRS